MTSKERIALAMRLEKPDRIPVMCQLSIGHYFLHAGIDPIDIWYTSEGFAASLIAMQRRYRFDGILINLPGRDPRFRDSIDSIERDKDTTIIRWKNKDHTVIPADDLPLYYPDKSGKRGYTLDDIEPDTLFYIEPYDISGISYPYVWGFAEEPAPHDHFFTGYHTDTIRSVIEQTGDTVSVHSEIFSPWTQWLELLGYENALMAVIDDPEKVKACLERLAHGAAVLAKEQAGCGVDAVLISSAFAGAGFLSRNQYVEFVLPFEKMVIDLFKKEYSIPIYTHTCGKIGDRLDLMIGTGTNGIDTLDPPPLGNVELREAKRQLAGKAFIKGNIDPVHTLLKGDRTAIRDDVRERLAIGKEGGGYILSTACSVSPHTPPEHIGMLSDLAEEFGRYE
jgi:hypothetical protein